MTYRPNTDHFTHGPHLLSLTMYCSPHSLTKYTHILQLNGQTLITTHLELCFILIVHDSFTYCWLGLKPDTHGSLRWKAVKVWQREFTHIQNTAGHKSISFCFKTTAWWYSWLFRRDITEYHNLLQHSVNFILFSNEQMITWITVSLGVCYHWAALSGKTCSC